VASADLINGHHDGRRPFANLLTGKQFSDALITRGQELLADHDAEAAPASAMMQLSGLVERTFSRPVNSS